MIRAPNSLVVVRLAEVFLHLVSRSEHVSWRGERQRINRKNINANFKMSIENLSNRPATVTIRQVKAARALLGWSQGDLAERSSVSEPTIARLEADDGQLGGRPETVAKIIKALTIGGIDFIPENGGGLGVRLTRSRDAR